MPPIPFLIIGWIFLSVIVAFAGNNTRLGFWGTLLSSLIFSPLIIFFLIGFRTKK
ncbi:MAG: hypothetical protein ACKOXB_09255 [Flavobacteriales bacterium]